MKETTACSRELGFELRRRRELAGLSSVELAGRLGWSHSKISRLETGWRGAADTDVVQYLALLGYSSDEMRGLRALSREASRDLGYWLGSGESLGFHEALAEICVSYCPEVVPAPMRVGDNTVFRPNPRRVFLLHERVLSGMGLEQVLKLLLLTEMPFLTVQVVQGGEIYGGGFRILQFGTHRPLVHVEGEYVGLFLEDHDAVAAYGALAGRIMDAALSPEQTREQLVQMAAYAHVTS
jgi:transcriptional regulator with XRE-family HTH domain